ncbi:MAG: hypothetical protein GF388_10865, partial [Candidatus Aegiribacteria sp.]|nr:hypothetical protein [Candidatus Aegiribacteria sp.]MBD3295511.1 hypothetical protein [Candidatus Fermentibacteria bacterium]
MKHSILYFLVLALAAAASAQGFQVDTDLSSEWEATGFNNGRSMVRDADGYFHMVYHSQVDPNSPPGGPCDIYYSHTLVPAPPTSSADWSPAVPIVTLPEDDRYPSIAVEHGSSSVPGCNDTLHVVWQSLSDVTGVFDIYHISCPNRNVPPPDAWSIPAIVHTSPMNSLVPDIDCSLGNIVHVVWQEEDIEGGFSEILYSRSTDHGATWSPFFNVSQTPVTNSQMPDVATVIDFPEAPSYFTYYSENVHVAWNDDLATTPPDIYYTVSPNAGLTWTTPVDVSVNSGSGGEDGYPSMTVSRDDIPHIVWMHGVIPHDPDTPGPY